MAREQWPSTLKGTLALVRDNPSWGVLAFVVVTFLPPLFDEFVLGSAPAQRSNVERLADALAPNVGSVALLGCAAGVVFVGIVPRLQRKDARSQADKAHEALDGLTHIDFDVVAYSETLPEQQISIGDLPYSFPSTLDVLWVEVWNRGPNSDFSGRIENIEGVARFGTAEIIGSYSVNRLAWEHELTVTQIVSRGSYERLMVGEYAMAESVLWLLMPASARWGPGDFNRAWRLTPTSSKIDFDLIVSNVGGDKHLRRRMRVEFADNGELASFGVIGERD